MPDVIISIKNLGKKYTLSHKHGGNYVALRDVITEKIKGIGQGILRRSAKRHQSKSEEEFWALKDVSLDIKQGEVIGIIGRNGAGKSTLLKILSRITEPTTGRIHIKGRVASLLEVGTGFHPELTGRENIFLNGSILGMGRSEIKKKFDEIVEFAEIEKFLDTPVKRYSSGMYVRLAFAVAAHLDSDILLIDEVLAVGDVAFQKKCLGKVRDVGKDGRTVLYVSHNLRSVRNLCSRSIYLKIGKISHNGLTSTVVNEYERDNLLDNGISNITIRENEEIKHTSFCIKKIEIMNVEGDNTNLFKYNDIMVMDVTLMGEPDTSHYSFEYRIYGTVGTAERIKSLIAVAASGPFHNIYFHKKVKKIRIKLGPLTLSSGDYSISTSIMTGNVRQDTWEDCCSFNITDCQAYVKNNEVSLAGCILQHSFSIL